MSYAKRILRHTNQLEWLKVWPTWKEGRRVNNSADAVNLLDGCVQKIPTHVGKEVSQAAGVYVDVCFKDKRMILGFVVIQDSKIVKELSLESQHKHTAFAEEEAVRVAHQRFPESEIYCDCEQVVKKLFLRFPVHYINRKLNKYAHHTARHKRGFEHGYRTFPSSGSGAKSNPRAKHADSR